MNVVSRIQFPRTPETSELYIKCNNAASINLNAEKVEVALTKNGVLSLNTYFNSFYETFYAKYTELYSLYYLLKLEGDIQVSLYREFYDRENRELIHTENFENCQPSEPVKTSIPDSWRDKNAGRIYLEITCLSDRGAFVGGLIATDQPKTREVSLGIVTCTFKKEAYVKNTINTILQDNCLQNKNFQIYIVDNGKTLNQAEFKTSKVKLIPNRNLGGAGGFTRGLIQALQEGIHTHFLFMDDDIELKSESIYKLFSLYEYANQDFAISGSMLDLYKKHILYEAGALYSKFLYPDGNYGYNPFTVVALKKKLNLNNSSVNNCFLLEERPDYGAFWFFSFSKKVVEEIGLPMPFFIRGDDIEFGLRITERIGRSIVAFPSIAVWHEPFYAKNPIWINYYTYRNHLVTHSIRGSLKYLDAVKFLTKILLYKIFIFDYNSAEMMLRGFEDYMKGPLVIKTEDPETLHTKVLELSKHYKTQSVEANYTAKCALKRDSVVRKNKESTFKKIVYLLTLNGHLLPNFLLSKDSVFYWIGSDYEDWWFKVFTKKRVFIFREGNNSVDYNEMSRTVGLGILMKWFQLVITSAIRWSSVSAEWRNAFGYFTSIEFWKEYLKLKEET
ncbi:glycosyltransferase [Scytonema sp. NUACC26]|uniref:glycosyltransferase n=1 Tax=Scytonema sp. NUACC26 TaxID=3140176 RepID=UPI0034DC4DF7